ncbi:hypothetical protein ZHAS_00003929 [Anopheles sinensis]|uniref:Uncharacterized protein n=1 Tax=Anopheles sinensis TaxID=74873 RepID=A0A084VFM6_ANOSI|nr:hypothetical protein ZHAS_00003929 [Anopheles sinensis]
MTDSMEMSAAAAGENNVGQNASGAPVGGVPGQATGPGGGGGLRGGNTTSPPDQRASVYDMNYEISV